MYVKLLIFAFCASQVACGEIADNLRQEYEDMINNTAQVFTNFTNFLNAMAQQYGQKIGQGMQKLETERVDLRDELQVLATDAIYNDSRLMTCYLAGQQHIYRYIDVSEERLGDLWQVECNFVSDELANVQKISDAVDAFVRQIQEAIFSCDGVNSDVIDSCFSGLNPETNDTNTNIINQINQQGLFAIQFFSDAEDNLNIFDNETDIYLNTGYQDARQDLINCIGTIQINVTTLLPIA